MTKKRLYTEGSLFLQKKLKSIIKLKINVGVLRKTDICEQFKYRYYTPSHRDDIFINADFNRRQTILGYFNCHVVTTRCFQMLSLRDNWGDFDRLPAD
jgi:hypothetical protein